MMRFASLWIFLALNACSSPSARAPEAPVFQADTERLRNIAQRQDEDVQNRFTERHPVETLSFFGIAPGMTVVEVLPGGGWYSKILVPYLGSEGHLVGVDYALEMWPNFPFGTEQFVEKRKQWPEQWVNDTQDWGLTDGASAEAYAFGQVPQRLTGSADAVLFIRALHNLARFEAEGGYLSYAISEAYRWLKPGGIVGVVQHQAPESSAEDWADGSRGYLKKSRVIDIMTDAGFEFVAESDINENPEDNPGINDMVWRLPPSLATSQDNPELRQRYQAIGESNRMTLTFRKPMP